MWPSAWGSYESTPEGLPVQPQGLFQYLTGQNSGPEGFSSSTSVDAVVQCHGASCQGKTVFIIGERVTANRPPKTPNKQTTEEDFGQSLNVLLIKMLCATT